MKIGLRGASASLLALALTGMVGCSQEPAAETLTSAAETAQQTESTTTEVEKQQLGYAMGVDVGASFAPLASFIDQAAFRAAIEDTFAGKAPALSQQEAQLTDMSVRVAMIRKSGQPVPPLPPGVEIGEPDPVKVGQMLGGYAVGPSLSSFQDSVSLDAFFAALKSTFESGKADVTHEQAVEYIQTFAQARAEKLGEENRRIGSEFLEANKARPGVVTTESGLQYQVIRPGSGAQPSEADRVRVNYQGKLLDGTVFDSSYERGEPVEFALTQVIPGWREGVAQMPTGAKYRFWIPSDLAYGPQGAPGGKIGPDATLTFDVELMGVLPTPAQ